MSMIEFYVKRKSKLVGKKTLVTAHRAAEQLLIVHSYSKMLLLLYY